MDTRSPRSIRRPGEAVTQSLRSRIDRREWQTGSRLPSIRALAAEYQVAPLTIRRCLDVLESEQWIDVIPNRGAFVVIAPALPTVAEDFSWQRELLRRRESRTFSVTLPSTVEPMAVNLATGTMSNEAVPVASLRKAIKRAADRYQEGRVCERSPIGELELREAICELTRDYGVKSRADSTLIVSSTHQAFRVIGASIIDRGEYVLIESPSDPIVMSTFESIGARCIPVTVDAEGMEIDRCRAAIERYRPKAVITCSSGQIPTGVTMPYERRKQLYDICREHRCLLIEYDNGNGIWFETPPPHPIKSLDENGTVIYVREFAREVSAGIRIACIQAEGPIFARLVDNKRRDDLLTSTIGQMQLNEYLRSDYARNLVHMRAFYSERRRSALDAIRAYIPPEFTWFEPKVGFHIWMQVPEGISARTLTEVAATRGVIVAPSEVFSIDGKLDNALRITFSDNPPALIQMGIMRLGEACRSLMRRSPESVRQRIFEVI